MKKRVYLSSGIAWISTVLFFASMAALIALKIDHSAHWEGLSAEMAETIMLDKGDPIGPYITVIGAGTISFGILAMVLWIAVWNRRRTRQRRQFREAAASLHA